MHTTRKVKSNEYYEKKEFKAEKRKSKGKDSPHLENYYGESGKSLGFWKGEGAEALGLAGLPVYPNELGRLQAGFHPKTGKQLFVPRKGREGKAVSWHYMDNCFSAVKDFSLLKQLDNKSNDYDSIFANAIDWSISKMQSLAYSRKYSQGKTTQQKIKLIVVHFHHETSRGDEKGAIPDMQEHEHVLVFKQGVLANGKIGAVENKWMLDNSKLLGTGFRAKLANGLRKMGYEIIPHKEKFQEENEGMKSKSVIANAFGIKGITDQMRDNFSKRHESILKASEEAGTDDSVSKGFIAQKGKAAKEDWTKNELMASWTEAANSLGLTSEYIQTLKTFDNRSLVDNIKTEHKIIKGSFSHKKNKQTGIITKTLYERNLRLKCFEYEQYTGIDGEKMFKSLVENKLVERQKGFIYKCNINLELLSKFERNLKNRINADYKNVYDKFVGNSEEVRFTVNDLIIDKKVELPKVESKKKVTT